LIRITNQKDILKIAKRKKRVTARQGEADFWALEDMVKKGLLHKTLPTHKKAYGWPVYIITRKGLRALEK
jgi:hypothetical protein